MGGARKDGESALRTLSEGRGKREKDEWELLAGGGGGEEGR